MKPATSLFFGRASRGVRFVHFGERLFNDLPGPVKELATQVGIADSVIASVERIAEANGALVEVDSVQIHQVLVNLLRNAIEAMNAALRRLDYGKDEMTGHGFHGRGDACQLPFHPGELVVGLYLHGQATDVVFPHLTAIAGQSVIHAPFCVLLTAIIPKTYLYHIQLLCLTIQ